MKDKTTASLLALFLGMFGAHKFYLGRTGVGVVYLLLTFTLFFAFIPAIMGLIDFFVLALMDGNEFNRRYNGSNTLGPGPVVVNMLPPGQGAPHPGYHPPPPAGYPPQQGYRPPPSGPQAWGPAAQPPVPQPSPEVDPDELAVKLQKLNELRISGLLSEEEFNEQKARLLGQA